MQTQYNLQEIRYNIVVSDSVRGVMKRWNIGNAKDLAEMLHLEVRGVQNILNANKGKKHSLKEACILFRRLMFVCHYRFSGKEQEAEQLLLKEALYNLVIAYDELPPSLLENLLTKYNATAGASVVDALVGNSPAAHKSTGANTAATKGSATVAKDTAKAGTAEEKKVFAANGK